MKECKLIKIVDKEDTVRFLNLYLIKRIYKGYGKYSIDLGGTDIIDCTKEVYDYISKYFAKYFLKLNLDIDNHVDEMYINVDHIERLGKYKENYFVDVDHKSIYITMQSYDEIIEKFYIDPKIEKMAVDLLNNLLEKF